MAALPKNDLTTIARIEQSWEESQKPPRAHLGASQIGEACHRKLWFGFRWCLTPQYSGRLLRLFQHGHDYEQEFIKNLRKIGIRTWTLDPDTGQQFSYTDHGGHFGGSCDGIVKGLIEAPVTRHLIEFKTSADKQFKEIVKDGIEKAKPVHYAQIQVYLHAFKLTRAFYLVVNKNNHSLYSERIKYDKTTAENLIQKAIEIIDATTPPERISERPDSYECSWCDYKNICHNEMIPEVNCRTCLHATPLADGVNAQWHCNFYRDNIPVEFQRKGCDKHLYIPDLVPFKIVEVHEKDNWILYEDGGKQFYNGPKDEYSFPSAEFRHVRGVILNDPSYQKINKVLGPVELIALRNV